VTVGEFVVPGAIDLHCHFHLDDAGRRFGPPHDGVPAQEVVRDAIASGHRAVVLKSHSFASPQLAYTLTELFPEIQVFGGICTDYFSGGLNVAAVESALVMGAKIVWLPTVHSVQDVTGANRIRFQGKPISCLDDDGELVNEVHEIAALAREAGAVLATGHISAREHYAVARRYAATQQVLITHAGHEAAGPELSLAQIIELADLGSVIEFTALECHGIARFGLTGVPPADLAKKIAAVGADRCTLSSDYGYGTDFGRPGHDFIGFLERLWNSGTPERDIVTMAAAVPGRLLGLGS
jgi:hypothetical protein